MGAEIFIDIVLLQLKYPYVFIHRVSCVLCCCILLCNAVDCTIYDIWLLSSLTVICSFLRQHLGSTGPETADVEALKLEVTDLRQKVEKLNEENTELKQKVCDLL